METIAKVRRLYHLDKETVWWTQTEGFASVQLG
jgi:hypothetical protein